MSDNKKPHNRITELRKRKGLTLQQIADAKGGGKVGEKEASANQNRIKQLRLERHKTQKEVGKAIGLSDRAIAHYEKGIREPKLETWEKLANFFNVSVSYLMGISDQTLKLYRVSTSFDSYIVKASSEERAKELVWLDEVEAIPESWTDEYDVQELDIKNMDVEGVISRGN